MHYLQACKYNFFKYNIGLYSLNSFFTHISARHSIEDNKGNILILSIHKVKGRERKPK